MGTEAREFHHGMLHGEALAAGGRHETRRGIAVEDLGDIPAAFADEQGRGRTVVAFGAWTAMRSMMS